MKKKILAVVLCAACAAFGGVMASAADAPGSEGDPLVTKSYVDAKLAALSGAGGTAVSKDDVINEVMAQIKYFYGDALESAAFTPAFLSAGDTLVGHEGTEIILRSGKAMGFVGVENGIADITSGTEIFNGGAVAINHLLVVPKYDARGIKATTDAWTIVRGGYDILK